MAFIGMIIVIALIVFILGFMAMYNGLVGKKNMVDMAFSTIDVQLKNRYDLIPNLVSTVKQYAAHEKGVLEKITELRTRAVNLKESQSEQSLQINNEISKMLKGLMISVENYPQLRANENFMQLQGQLSEMEAQIAAARRTYNAAITDYNNALEMIPTNIMATLMGYRRKSVLETSTEERQNVKVDKLFNS
ncbi:MAG: LemA family protein [Pseudomonadota bacterium]